MSSEHRYNVEDFAFIGRTFEEYSLFFSLNENELSGKSVLDCPAGASSFTAEARKHGVDTVAADILYHESPAALGLRATTDIERAISGFDQSADLFNWDFYPDVESLRSQRESAASKFLYDYAHNGARYVQTTLPDLPFPENSFDLVLSAHFLFLYDDRLTTQLHIDTIKEFLRVGRELRLFPLHAFDSEQSSEFTPVIENLTQRGCEAEIRTVPFEFQRGANKMLVVRGA